MVFNTITKRMRWLRVSHNQVYARVSLSSLSWGTSGPRPTREPCRIKSWGSDKSSTNQRRGGRSPASSPRSTWTTGTSMIASRSNSRTSRLRSRRSTRAANSATSSSPEWPQKLPPLHVRTGNSKLSLRAMGSHVDIQLRRIQLRPYLNSSFHNA